MNGVALTEDDELAHDFEYVIGNTSFESVNSDPEDENLPVFFSAYIITEESEIDYGLGYVTDASPISWELWPGDSDLEVTTEGFGSGPVITVVPEPGSMTLLGMGAGLLGMGLFRHVGTRSRHRRSES